jgi:RND family efflux transporter MFP subunit
VVLLAAGCGTKASTEPAAGEAAPKAVPVTLAQATRRTVERTVPVTGSLRGWEQVTVGAKRTGRVQRVLRDMGDTVPPGEPLAQLETVDAELAVKQAEAQYLGELVKLGISRQQAEEYLEQFGATEELLRGEFAERMIKAVPAVVERQVAMEKANTDVTRQRGLFQRGVGSNQELQTFEDNLRAAKAAYENAILVARTVIASALSSRLALEVAQEALEDMVIRAPRPTAVGSRDVAGVTYAVVQRHIAEGQMLQAGAETFGLVIDDPLRLWAGVPERYVGQVAVGQTARLRVAAFPNRDFEGRVARINPSVDEVSRTFQVEVEVPNGEELLRPGGFAETQIVVQREDEAVVVPLEAVVEFAGVTKVFVVEAGKSRAVPVRKGLEGRGWVEVVGELKGDETVATSGQSRLAEGTPVVERKVAAGEPAPAEAKEAE